MISKMLSVTSVATVLSLASTASYAQNAPRYECGAVNQVQGFEIETRTIGKRSAETGDVTNYISRASIAYKAPLGTVRYVNDAVKITDTAEAHLSYNLFTNEQNDDFANLTSLTVMLTGFSYDPKSFIYTTIAKGRELSSHVLVAIRKPDGSLIVEFPVSVMANREDDNPDKGFFVSANILDGVGPKPSDMSEAVHDQKQQEYLNSAIEGISKAGGAVTVALNDYLKGDGEAGDIVTFTLPAHDAAAMIQSAQQTLRTDTSKLMQGQCPPQ